MKSAHTFFHCRNAFFTENCTNKYCIYSIMQKILCIANCKRKLLDNYLKMCNFLLPNFTELYGEYTTFTQYPEEVNH